MQVLAAAVHCAAALLATVRRRKSKIAGCRAALAVVQQLSNRRTKFVVLAFESSSWTEPTVQTAGHAWEQRASRRLPGIANIAIF